MTVDTATPVPVTATGPTARSTVRSVRGPVAVVVGLALVVGLIALLAGTRRTGALDPRAFDPGGARALAQVLEGRGTTVEVIGDLADLPSGVVLVLPFPDAMSDADLARAASSRVVVVAPDQASLDALGVDATVSEGAQRDVLAPSCKLDVAANAGAARVGGAVYTGSGEGCYDVDGRPSLYREGSITVVGNGDFLTNSHLGDDGNAALALGLLEPSDRIAWLLPAAGTGGEQDKGLLDLLPTWVLAAAAQLAVATVVLALWRARRLGRVVPEPLPVIVRAAEAVEGRGRLYRAAKARDRAAEALRSASLDAATRRLGLGAAAEPAAVVLAAADRTSRPTAEVETLLYGPVPADDAALLRLADALARFDSEVSPS